MQVCTVSKPARRIWEKLPGADRRRRAGGGKRVNSKSWVQVVRNSKPCLLGKDAAATHAALRDASLPHGQKKASTAKPGGARWCPRSLNWSALSFYGVAARSGACLRLVSLGLGLGNTWFGLCPPSPRPFQVAAGVDLGDPGEGGLHANPVTISVFFRLPLFSTKGSEQVRSAS